MKGEVKVKVTQLCLTLATPWTVAHQAPLYMGFFRQGYWSGLPFPSPRHPPDPGIESKSAVLKADSLPTVHCTMQFYIGHLGISGFCYTRWKLLDPISSGF